jgi:hypothetical protein
MADGPRHARLWCAMSRRTPASSIPSTNELRLWGAPVELRDGSRVRLRPDLAERGELRECALLQPPHPTGAQPQCPRDRGLAAQRTDRSEGLEHVLDKHP